MKVLVVDDSVIYRRVLEDIVKGLAFVEQVDSAANGGEALAKAYTSQPDVITLDVEMPDISGLQVLRALHATNHKAAVVVISAHTDAGTRMAIEAMELGALDVVVKPTGLSGKDAIRELSLRLRPIMQAVAMARGMESGGQAVRTTAPATASGVVRPPEIIAMGASTGGPAALSRILRHLPGDLPIPVVVAVHMPVGFTRQLAKSLDIRCAARVVEASNGLGLRPRTIYVAPAGRHLRLSRAFGMGGTRVVLSDDPPVHQCRPSVDVLFQSVAQVYGARSLGVLLTGMGRDGAEGLSAMKARGARTMAQDEHSSVVWGMPRVAIEAGTVDVVGSPEELVTYLLAAMKA